MNARRRPACRAAALALGLGMALAGAAAPLAAQGQRIVAADYVEPTERYDHAILGDAIEWGALRLRFAGGGSAIVRLPASRVFEDIAPRLQDLDGDGAPEVIAIETDIARGARLSVYGAEGLIAATPFIGRTHRWLSPVGAGDLDGDGFTEIAYVDRPHLAKVLRIWRFREGTLEHVSDTAGFSNHRIGWDYMLGGVRDCGAGPEVITPDASYSRVMALRLAADGSTSSRALSGFDGADSVATALACGS